MFSLTGRTSKPRGYTLAKLVLALVTVGFVGLGSIAPAAAWYDSYGYWHPDYRYRNHYRHDAYWRHREWCERHPGACYSGPDYNYYNYDYNYNYGYDRY